MKAKEKKLLHFLEGSDKHFVIPVYQRNYDWGKYHCKQLFDDLIDVAKMNRTHFLGSIVSIYHDDGEDREYLIIDGQQRLTTISLLLLALYKIIDEKKLNTEINKEQIRDEYLVNKYSKNDKKIRLKPVKNDKKAFSNLFKNEDDYIRNTNITINFKYFYDRILKSEIDADKLFSAIKQLIIVEIELKNSEDDPQLIFESLNSTGLDLTEADKIRNFILMKESVTTQEKYYNEYWNKIEINTNYNVSSFIKNYLTIKERAIPNKNKIYFYFKKYAAKNANKVEDLLKDLLKFSIYYKSIINADTADNKLSFQIHKINRLETFVTYPFIMEVLEDVENEIVNSKTAENIFKILVNFIFRRLICEVPTNALNKIFMILGKEIKKHENCQNNYLEIFKYILIKKKLSQRFPDDDEFSEKIIQKDIYNSKSKNRLFLLEQLENHNNKERVDIENLINENDLNIEHIMPQTLTRKWKKELGEDYEATFEKYLHTIGNITLTGYNSKMSNKPFLEKRDMEKGFKESRLFLNQYLHNLENWNEETIKNRANILKNRALEIWNYPQTKYKSENDKLKKFSLADDDKNFAGEKIISFKFMDDKNQPVKNWKDFYKKVCSVLFELEPVRFKQIVIDNRFVYTEDSSTDLKKHLKVDSLYVYGILDTETMLARLRKLVKDIDLDLDDLNFVIK